MRTTNVDHENNKTSMVDKERMMPAPMITGREILAESSKDEITSQPSRQFASIDRQREHEGG